MGVGSFGSFLDAARSTPRAPRGRTEMLRARILASRPDANTQPLYEDFACFHWCEECHHLLEDSNPCVHCGSTHLVDLRDFSAARFLQEAETVERRTVSSGVRWLARLYGFSLYVGMTCLWFRMWDFPGAMVLDFFGVSGGGLTFLTTLGVLFLMVFSPFFVLPGLAMFLGKQARIPIARFFSRWTFPTPLRRRLVDAPFVQGLSPSPTPTTSSPLTGRAVCGWRWQVFLRDPMATSRKVLVLDEQWRLTNSPDLQGHWLEMKSLDEEDFVLSEAERQQFLRKRGIFWDDGEFVWKESVFLSSAEKTLA